LSIGGNAATATDSVNAGITAVSTNASYYPTFVSATTGNLPVDVATGLTFNPSTNNLSTTTFTGALVGNATTSTASTNATVTAVSTNASYYPTFVSATTGNLPVDVATGFTFNPSTNTVATTNVDVSGQFTSTVVTGTAPLVVASTTQVANLNASTLIGSTWEAPGAIGFTTANTGAFTTISATSTVNLSPANTTVTISPSASGTVIIAPATLSSMDNVTIGTTTQAAGHFTSLSANQAVSLSNGNFSTVGDARQGIYVLRNVTADAAPTELFLDGVTASQQFVMRDNSVYTFTMLIAGRRTDQLGGGAGYKIEGVVRKDATSASITIIGAISKSILGETNVAWDATVTADTTTGSIKVAVTGETGKSINWVATVTTCEVVG
jgi:hypothetical protein